MNQYFYKIWLPLQVTTALALIALSQGYLAVDWMQVFIAWFLIGPVGLGVGYHKLFSHRQFNTFKPLEYIIATFGTLSAYAPLLFWCSQHQYHHSVSDTESDPSSPVINGFWESFLWWRMRDNIFKKTNLRNYCVKLIIKDKFLMFLSKYFIQIIWTTAIALSILDLNLLLNLFLLPILIEHFRVNLISSASHIKLPTSYRNHDTNDQSYNNILIGVISLGFGWHNNHHNNPGELINMHRWWEIDVEGIIAWSIRKTNV